ncbi:hypothetical protein [Nocardia inohanensis]|uniref:hypothetical protein n=1 Tax=Nocardia inohanensis TaxID=209246 RepID=UPI00082F5FC7|nr:hypothetical protein [Nocardia inohanensis]
MALHTTPWSITSDVSPEFAVCTPTSGDGWILSWLPARVLSYEQAVSGMVLDEILSDPTLTDPGPALELAEIRAAELGMELREVVVRLAVRVEQRDRRRAGAARRRSRRRTQHCERCTVTVPCS